jgi:hypothetical protein
MSLQQVHFIDGPEPHQLFKIGQAANRNMCLAEPFGRRASRAIYSAARVARHFIQSAPTDPTSGRPLSD